MTRHIEAEAQRLAIDLIRIIPPEYDQASASDRRRAVGSVLAGEYRQAESSLDCRNHQDDHAVLYVINRALFALIAGKPATAYSLMLDWMIEREGGR